jgi:glycosyltransferase involved in cell wall biosynthesis
MQLTHIVDRLDGIGGVQTYLSDLLPALRRLGVDGTVITERGAQLDGPSLPGAAAKRLRAAVAATSPDVCIVHVAPSPGVVRVCRELAPTLIFAHDYFMACPGNARYLERSERFCGEGPGLRCFRRAYTERTANRRPDRLMRAYRRQRAWREAWRAASRILVASPFVAETLAAQGVDRRRIGVLPYFVPSVAVGGVRRELDVLFLGRLVPMKGAHVLIEALADTPGATAAIGGEGAQRPTLEGLVDSLGLRGRVRILGGVGPSERDRLLARARVFVLPSLWAEPFGIVGLEALAAGVPVVGSDVGGIPSWLQRDEAGLLVPPGDREALASAIRRLLDEPALHERLAAAAPMVAARYSIERHLDGLLAAVNAARQF